RRLAGAPARPLDLDSGAMRRVAVLALGCAFVLAGCGSGTVVTPVANTVEGKLPTAAAGAGNAAAGKSVFTSTGCGSCHTYEPAKPKPAKPKPAPSGGKVGAGNAAAGKTLFASQGCVACHTFKPAGSKASVGPDLDKLAADAKKARRGSVQQYAHESIKNPSA